MFIFLIRTNYKMSIKFGFAIYSLLLILLGTIFFYIDPSSDIFFSVLEAKTSCRSQMTELNMNRLIQMLLPIFVLLLFDYLDYFSNQKLPKLIIITCLIVLNVKLTMYGVNLINAYLYHWSTHLGFNVGTASKLSYISFALTPLIVNYILPQFIIYLKFLLVTETTELNTSDWHLILWLSAIFLPFLGILYIHDHPSFDLVHKFVTWWFRH